MSWTNSAPEPLKALLENKDTHLIDILKNDSVKSLFQRQSPPALTEFILQHSGEIADIVFGFTKPDFIPAFQLSFSIIITQIQLSKLLFQNLTFLQKMSDFISSDGQIEEKYASSFARIFQFYVQLSSSSIPFIFPHRETLFESILKHSGNASIANLLFFLTDDGQAPIISFLEESNATSHLIASLGSAISEENVLRYLANIVISVGSDSSLYDVFADQKVVSQLYDLALHSEKVAISSAAFNLLFQLYSSYESYEEGSESDPSQKLQPLTQFIDTKLDEICTFVRAGTQFLSNKCNAVDLIATAVLTMKDGFASVNETIVFLWNQFFLYPHHTFLHHAFLTMFDAAFTNKSRQDQLLQLTNMKAKILDAFSHKDAVSVSYYGHLYVLVGYIVDAEGKDKGPDDWKSFVNTTYSDMKKTIESEYGGPLPQTASPFSDSDSGENLDVGEIGFDESDSSEEEYSWSDDGEEEEDEK